jgi:signal transduction histidine kinase
MVEKVRGFFDADTGVMILDDPLNGRSSLFRTAKSDSRNASSEEELPDQLRAELLGLGPSTAIVYNKRQWPLSRPVTQVESFDVRTGGDVTITQSESESLAEIFEARSFLTVPIFRNQRLAGRMYFASVKGRLFRRSHAEFLLSVIAQAFPVIENVKLVDTLASDAAEQERQRIARDIHDSIIQPYIGFQIALSGVRRKLAGGQVDLASEVEQLAQMTSVGVTDLRRYVAKLKTGDNQETTLSAALDRFARRFTEATGIKVDLLLDPNLRLQDTLAAEVFQMASEGLSNIRKHTEATQATIVIEVNQNELELQIRNDGTPLEDRQFMPRSISERAASLNGTMNVQVADSQTIVQVRIPL